MQTQSGHVTKIAYSLTDEFYNANWVTLYSNGIDSSTSIITKHKHTPSKIVKITQSDPKRLISKLLNVERVLRNNKKDAI